MVDQNPTTLFNDIYDSTNRKVLVYITAKCSSPADIHDIFQETYMELYSILVKKGPDYIQNSEAFVMKLAKQKLSRYYSLLDRLKRLLPLSSPPENEDWDASMEQELDSVPIDELVCSRDLAARVYTYLSSKPTDVKRFFICIIPLT
ncbi:MAG: hypothetical protein ACLR23_26845 [Clostridia bacterium]